MTYLQVILSVILFYVYLNWKDSYLPVEKKYEMLQKLSRREFFLGHLLSFLNLLVIVVITYLVFYLFKNIFNIQ
jgi:uncharacterized membrane protein YbhN (UPF0104 family)